MGPEEVSGYGQLALKRAPDALTIAVTAAGDWMSRRSWDDRRVQADLNVDWWRYEESTWFELSQYLGGGRVR